MTELLQACLHPVNFPYSVFLTIVVGYWVSVVWGAADVDPTSGDPGGEVSTIEAAEVDGDLALPGADAAADLAGDADAGDLAADGGDAGADGADGAAGADGAEGGGADGDAIDATGAVGTVGAQVAPGTGHAATGGPITTGVGPTGELIDEPTGREPRRGWLRGALAWALDLGEVPVTIPVSVLALSLWTISLVVNHHLGNTHGYLLALGLAVPNLLVSALITKVLTWPARLLFRRLGRDKKAYADLVGKTGRVVTSSVTDRFGQIEVATDGAPLLLHARYRGTETPHKGDRVILVAHDRKSDTYLIQPFNVEEH